MAYAKGQHIERILLRDLLLADRLVGIRLPGEIVEAIGKNSALQVCK